MSEIKSKQLNGCWAMFIGAGLIVFSFVLGVEFGGGNIIWLLILLGLTILISAFFYNQNLSDKFNKVSKDEFADYRYQIPNELISCLCMDIDPDSDLEINLNLKEFPTPDPSGQNRTEKTSNPKGERKFVATQEPILSVSGKFMDGTKFNYEINEHISAYGEWFYYRAISGKTKTKLRARKRTRWVSKLRLRYKNKRYDTSSISISDLESFAQMPQGARLKKVKTGDSEVTLVSVTDPVKQKIKLKLDTDIDGALESMTKFEKSKVMLSKMSVMGFLSLYQALNSCSYKK